MEHYANAHSRWHKEKGYYDKIVTKYTIWREAAAVLRYVAEGRVTVEELRKATER